MRIRFKFLSRIDSWSSGLRRTGGQRFPRTGTSQWSDSLTKVASHFSLDRRRVLGSPTKLFGVEALQVPLRLSERMRAEAAVPAPHQ